MLANYTRNGPEWTVLLGLRVAPGGGAVGGRCARAGSDTEALETQRRPNRRSMSASFSST